ncbi:unnamed protein product [Phytomonas sp. EM1]|nr:unnamed protein product [Phytomonas sp. EM1]|eukprot:CCW63777.1 unnamed protein product [Phytomonas sp. isolate EM1]
MSPCWKRSIAALRSDCANIRADNPLRTRLALGMAACDSEGDGRGGSSSFYCKPQQSPHNCVRTLSEPAYAIFIQYRLHTDVLCAFLQEELFQERTEAAVAALESAAELSIDSLTTLQHSNVKLLRTAEETMESQQESKRLTVELQEYLQKLQNNQTNTMQRLQVSAHDILHISKHTEESLLRLQELLNSVAFNASCKLDELVAQAAEHYTFMEQRTSKIFNVLKYIEETHKKMMGRTISLRRALQYMLVVLIIIFFTMSRRTSAARLPVLGFLAAGPLACMFTGGGRFGCVPWIVVAVGAAMMTIGYFWYTYVSVECLQRQMVHEEVMHIVKKSQMDLMAWMGDKEVSPSLCSSVSSVKTIERMPSVSSLLHQAFHPLLPWAQLPKESVPSPINTVSFPSTAILDHRIDDKNCNRSQEAHPEKTMLEVDIEPSRPLSLEVAIPKNPPRLPVMKRPRTKSTAFSSDKPIAMGKNTRSTRQRRRRIDK